MKGKIHNVQVERGFGFIEAEDGGRYFFHKSALPRGLPIERLSRGMGVTFTLEDSPKGQRAEDINVA